MYFVRIESLKTEYKNLENSQEHHIIGAIYINIFTVFRAKIVIEMINTNSELI